MTIGLEDSWSWSWVEGITTFKDVLLMMRHIISSEPQFAAPAQIFPRVFPHFMAESAKSNNCSSRAAARQHTLTCSPVLED